jgi:hypothetical protein
VEEVVQPLSETMKPYNWPGTDFSKKQHSKGYGSNLRFSFDLRRGGKRSLLESQSAPVVITAMACPPLLAPKTLLQWSRASKMQLDELLRPSRTSFGACLGAARKNLLQFRINKSMREKRMSAITTAIQT